MQDKIWCPSRKKVYFVEEGDDEDAEVDVEIIEKVLSNKSSLIMKVDEMPDTENPMPVTDAVKDKKDDDKESIMENSDALADDDKQDEDIMDRKEFSDALADDDIQDEDIMDRKEFSDALADDGKQDEDIMDRKEFSGEVPGKRSNASGSTERSSDLTFASQIEDYEVCDELRAQIDNYGFDNVGSILKTNLEKWKTIPLQIAVTGASGKGKSSFINALRGLTENDECAAEVGVTETTVEPFPYMHPEIDNFIVWDVPGVGTTQFPRENYFEQIQYERYDFFIIVFSERFTETDSWLMRELNERKPEKHRFVIRTKVDNDLRNEKRKATKGAFNEGKTFKNLKQAFHEEIKTAIPNDNNYSFFLISNHDDKKFDFPDLAMKLLKETPSMKRTTMIFALATVSKEIVKEKARVMHSRVWAVAFSAIVASLLSLTSRPKEISYILQQLDFYRNQFALDDKSLNKIALEEEISLDELKGRLAFNTPFELFTDTGIEQYYEQVRDTRSIFKIPLISDLISGRTFKSYRLSCLILTDMVDKMETDALNVMKFVTARHLC